MMEPASQNRTVEASQLEVSMSQRWPRPYSAEGELDLQHNSRHSLGVNRTSSGLARKLMRIFVMAAMVEKPGSVPIFRKLMVSRDTFTRMYEKLRKSN